MTAATMMAACGSPHASVAPFASSGSRVTVAASPDGGARQSAEVVAGISPTASTGDADSDGIADAVDACPNDPGSSNVDDRKNGCPIMGLLTLDPVIIIERITFAAGERSLSSASVVVLNAVITILRNNPELARVEVEGHASADEADSERLSLARANAVRQRIVAAGIEPSRIVARG